MPLLFAGEADLSRALLTLEFDALRVLCSYVLITSSLGAVSNKGILIEILFLSEILESIH